MSRLIYIDTCCYNRPFDDQAQERIKLESEAVLQTLNKCQVGDWNLLGSEALDFEISKIEDRVRRYKISSLYPLAEQKVKVNEDVEKRAKKLQSSGFAALNSSYSLCRKWER